MNAEGRAVVMSGFGKVRKDVLLSVAARARQRRQGALGLLLKSLALLVTMMLAAGSAAAQDVDLVVNLTDAGYDPTPVGGTVGPRP